MTISRRRLMQTVAMLPAASIPQFASAQDRQFRHGLTLFETLKYPQGFKHLDYVNPAAPKGGRLRLGVLGSFDSLNPFTLKGDPIDPGVNETLMYRSLDEPSSEYGLLAESVWYPDDYSQVVYRLHPDARFHDGEPVKPEDVIFSFESIKANLPAAQAYYHDIKTVEKTGEREVTFTFAVTGNRELPNITGQIAVVPKHWWTGKDANGKIRNISEPSLEASLGSGPYRVGKVVPGQNYVLERVKDYWGAALPVNVGQNNFDVVENQIYKDRTVMLEAFKGDQYDIHREATAKDWSNSYNVAAVKNGNIVKLEVQKSGVEGMQAWVPNLRREKFQDVRVRRALNLAMDFEWANQNLFYGLYKRSRSYFNNSVLEATGLPTPEELALLDPLKAELPPEVFTSTFNNPTNATPADRRKNLREAQALLTEAGWVASNQNGNRQLKNAQGEALVLEFLLYAPNFERVALPYKEQLELLGLVVNIRTIDVTQYQQRLEVFDYDIIVGSWEQSLSPGNEQREFWGSVAANKNGSRNSLGIKNKAIDALIEKLIQSPDRKSLITATHALDRVLMWNHFVVPMWHVDNAWYAHWKRVTFKTPLPGYGVARPISSHSPIWWFDEKADAEIRQN